MKYYGKLYGRLWGKYVELEGVADGIEYIRPAPQIPSQSDRRDAGDTDINFGDYVTIEMNRYGAPNEFYTHKVINRLKSNAWVDVPVVANPKETLHDEMAEVVSCICEGVVETDVFKYRVCDVKKLN